MFRPQYIEILKSDPKLLFFTNRPQNRDIGLLKIAFGVKFRCASFDCWLKKTNIRAGFRIWTSHPGRASHPDRAGHPIRSYLGYVWPYIYPMCAIRAYMAIYGSIQQMNQQLEIFVYNETQSYNLVFILLF